MFKLLFSAASCLLLLCSCTEKKNISYFWVRYNKDLEGTDTNWILQIDTLKAANTFQVYYLAQRDTIGYNIKPGQPSGSTIDWQYGGKGRLVWLSDTTVTIDYTSYKVTRYCLRDEAIDASTIHYWTPQVGIFAIHSGTWPIISILQCSDTAVNTQLNKLIVTTVPAFFISGQLQATFRTNSQ
jgi:hypothetical protein